MGIRDGKYRGDMPAARIMDDGLAYQKRRLLRGLARLASCERNGDEDLYGAIWQCSRLQLVRIRIKVPGPLVVAAEHIKRGFRASNLCTASDLQEVLGIPQHRSHGSEIMSVLGRDETPKKLSGLILHRGRVHRPAQCHKDPYRDQKVHQRASLRPKI